MVKKAIFLVVILIIFPSCVLYAINYNSSNMDFRFEEYTSNGELVSIVIETTKILDNYPYKSGWWGVGESEKPQNIISNVKVTVGKNNVTIPLSAYSDLANPYKVLFETQSNKFKIIIFGGDSATSYQAKLVFEQLSSKETRIKYRKVFHSEFSDEVWERTDYSFIVDDGR